MVQYSDNVYNCCIENNYIFFENFKVDFGAITILCCQPILAKNRR